MSQLSSRVTIRINTLTWSHKPVGDSTCTEIKLQCPSTESKLQFLAQWFIQQCPISWWDIISLNDNFYWICFQRTGYDDGSSVEDPSSLESLNDRQKIDLKILDALAAVIISANEDTVQVPLKTWAAKLLVSHPITLPARLYWFSTFAKWLFT